MKNNITLAIKAKDLAQNIEFCSFFDLSKEKGKDNLPLKDAVRIISALVIEINNKNSINNKFGIKVLKKALNILNDESNHSFGEMLDENTFELEPNAVRRLIKILHFFETNEILDAIDFAEEILILGNN